MTCTQDTRALAGASGSTGGSGGTGATGSTGSTGESTKPLLRWLSCPSVIREDGITCRSGHLSFCALLLMMGWPCSVCDDVALECIRG